MSAVPKILFLLTVSRSLRREVLIYFWYFIISVFTSTIMVSTPSWKNLSEQCHLLPLVLLIEDTSKLYEHLLKIMFLLHIGLPYATLSGHRDRFQRMFYQIKSFYGLSKQIQIINRLVQTPQLPETAPKFVLSASLSLCLYPPISLPNTLCTENINLSYASTCTEGEAVETRLPVRNYVQRLTQSLNATNFDQSKSFNDLSINRRLCSQKPLIPVKEYVQRLSHSQTAINCDQSTNRNQTTVNRSIRPDQSINRNLCCPKPTIPVRDYVQQLTRSQTTTNYDQRKFFNDQHKDRNLCTPKPPIPFPKPYRGNKIENFSGIELEDKTNYAQRLQPPTATNFNREFLHDQSKNKNLRISKPAIPFPKPSFGIQEENLPYVKTEWSRESVNTTATVKNDEQEPTQSQIAANINKQMWASDDMIYRLQGEVIRLKEELRVKNLEHRHQMSFLLDIANNQIKDTI